MLPAMRISTNKISTVLMNIIPGLKDVPHMEEFLDKRLHIELEKADTRNDFEWFKEHQTKYLPAMKAYRKYCVFDWSNFDDWLNDSDDDVKWSRLNQYIEKTIHGRCKDTLESKARHIAWNCIMYLTDGIISKPGSKLTYNWVMNEESNKLYDKVLSTLKRKGTIHDKCRQITLETGCR